MIASPAHAPVTLKNLLCWLRVLPDRTAREVFKPLFDPEYYLSTYPDVKRAGVSPFLHFLLRGFLESRNPSEHLESGHYLALYPDVKRSRINPALHYALYGHRERRSPVPGRTQVIEVSELGQLSGKRSGKHAQLDNAWPANTPLVSVVIPCFNYGAYVDQALQSVLQQTFHNFEVILVEGGSTDGVTPGMVARIEARDHPKVRVVYRSEPHLVGDNRNYGISHARGRYICCLDADDLLKPIYLETAVFFAEGYGYDIVYASVRSFGNSDLVWALTDASFPGILEGNQVATTALFRKEAWSTAGGYRDWGLKHEHIPEDWDFWVRLLAHGCRAKSIREPLTRYRVHGQGLTALCETDLEQQRAVLRRENRELIRPTVNHPAPLEIVEIANRWANIGAEVADDRPAILIAMPFITIGGAEQLFQTISEGLAARGYRIIVTTSLTPPDTIVEAPERYDAITPHVYHLARLLDSRSREDFILYLVRRHRVGGILLAGSELFYRALPRIRATFPEISILDQQFNDTGHIENNRRFAAAIDRTVVPSTSLADLLIQRYGEHPERVSVIPHGIDMPEALLEPEDALRTSGLPAQSRGKLLVSFFGRMSKEKSPEVFIEVAARLAHRSDLFFVMTGEGPEWRKVQKLAARYSLRDRLYMPGFVRDVRPLMELSGIVVLTSAVDGMPLVVLEAQALGKPVVASAVGSLPEMVLDGETGYLCPPGDVQAFGEAIERLADSAALRQSLGEQARRFVQGKYDSAAMLDAYVAAIDLDNTRSQSVA